MDYARRDRISGWGRASIVLTSVLAGMIPLSAKADQSPQERALAIVADGAKLYAAGDFAGALERYQSAHAIFPSPKIFFNMGQAYQGLGKPAAAVRTFERFLASAPDAPAEYLAEARKQVARLSKSVGFVTLASDTPDAEVLLDGVVVGSTQFRGRLAVDPGRHSIAVRSEKFGTQSRAFTAVAGKSLDLLIQLRSTEGKAPSNPTTPPPIEPPRASGAEQAEALIREATALRRDGKDAQAYPLFQKAYRIETTPRTAAQLALVEMQLGYWLLAEQHLTEALAAPRDPWIASNRVALETSLTRAKAAIGELVVTGSPPGATVIVNGKQAGNLPLAEPLRLGEGPANVEVQAPGHEPTTRSLSVVGGRREKLSVALVPKPAASTGLQTQVATQPDATSTATAGRFQTLRRPLAWTATAGAVAALGLGIYGTVRHQQKLDKFDTYRAPNAPSNVRASCGEDLDDRGGPECQTIHSDMRQARTLAIVGYVASGVLAVGAVTLFVLSPSERQPSGLSLACAPSVAPGAVCRLSF